MSIHQENFTFHSSADGIALQGTYIYPDAPRGIVQFLHGMAEHRARYFGVMTALAEAGYAAVIHDHRGHGDCPLTGHFGKAGREGLLSDAKQVTQLAKAKFPDLPFVLFGHSMGSLAARCYLKRYEQELDGLFLCGIPYAPPISIKAAQGLIALKIPFQGDTHRSHLVNGLVTGAFNKAIKDPASPNQWISYNEENVAAYDADPLCGFCFTLSGFQGLMGLMAEAYSEKGWAVKKQDLPIFMISGADDPCHTGEKYFRLAGEQLRKQGYRGVRQRLFPAMRHEILLEKEHQVVYDYLLESLNEFIGQPS